MDEQELVTDETLEVTENQEIQEEKPDMTEELKKQSEIAENYKIRAEKAEKEKKTLEAKLSKVPTEKPDALNFIKLGKKLESYSDEEIDFAVEHAKSKEPDAILAALEDEMVQLAIQAKRDKVEKEKLSLKPSSTQTDTDSPQSLEEALAGKSAEEQEKILTEAIGYNTTPARRSDTVYRR